MEKVCEICGKKFETTTGKKFCSVECVKKAKVLSNKKYKQAKKKERKHVCAMCGAEFTPKEKANSQKYCSPECAKKAQNLKKPQYKPLQKVCVICGAKFETRNYGTKTCSLECSTIYRRERAKLAFQNMGKDKVTKVSEEELKVQVMTITERHNFQTLRKAVNFLSAFTEYDAEECIELLRERKDKIGGYKIFYD